MCDSTSTNNNKHNGLHRRCAVRRQCSRRCDTPPCLPAICRWLLAVAVATAGGRATAPALCLATPRCMLPRTTRLQLRAHDHVGTVQVRFETLRSARLTWVEVTRAHLLRALLKTTMLPTQASGIVRLDVHDGGGGVVMLCRWLPCHFTSRSIGCLLSPLILFRLACTCGLACTYVRT